jgi:cytochrome c oxidase subunit II
LRPGPLLIRRRRLLALSLLVAAAGLLGHATGALAGAITPESGGSPNADDISGLYKLALYMGAFVFVAVEVALFYSLIRFRHRRGRVAAQIRGNTNLEISWTVAAVVLLLVLTVVTFTQITGIENPPASGPGGLKAAGPTLYASINQPRPPGGHSLNIRVNGQQYVWRYTYPNRAFAYDEMVVPIDTTVTLTINAQDVIHSWWIPKLGGKFDAVPGLTNYTWFKISKPGVYPGQCAELCGRNHANMLARVRAVPVDVYERWVARQKRLIDAANRAAAARAPQPSSGAPGGG